MRKKDRLHKKPLRYQNPDHWVAFKKQRNLVSRIVKESRSDCLNNVIEASLQEIPQKFGLTSDLVNQRTLVSPLCDMAITCALNLNLSCGPDEVPASVRKELAPSIAPWLSSIFRKSYHTGAVPPDWTKALVTAIRKKDSKSNPTNYRPISLTSLCCKAMEHIILSHIAKHLAANNILIDQQHGFRQRYASRMKLYLFQQSATRLDVLTRVHKLT